jgi:hypothetical protein
MGKQLGKDRLKNGVSTFVGSFDVSGPLACFNTQVIDLSVQPGPASRLDAKFSAKLATVKPFLGEPTLIISKHRLVTHPTRNLPSI